MSSLSLTEREQYNLRTGRELLECPQMELKIPTPQTFSFRRTVASHGWYGLLPFGLNNETWELSRVIDVGKKPPVTIRLTARKNHVASMAALDIPFTFPGASALYFAASSEIGSR